MTPEDFIRWISKQITHSKDNVDAQDYGPEAVEYCRGCLDTFKDVKEKFLTVQFHSQPIEEQLKSFTDGL